MSSTLQDIFKGISYAIEHVFSKDDINVFNVCVSGDIVVTKGKDNICKTLLGSMVILSMSLRLIFNCVILFDNESP
ncbi:hypothetical protein EHRUM3_01430, partial [Ehrlichia ruminantium]